MTERCCVNIGVGRKQRLLYEEAGLDDVSLKPYALRAEDVLEAFETARLPASRAKVRAYSEAQHGLLVEFREEIRARLLG